MHVPVARPPRTRVPATRPPHARFHTGRTEGSWHWRHVAVTETLRRKAQYEQAEREPLLASKDTLAARRRTPKCPSAALGLGVSRFSLVTPTEPPNTLHPKGGQAVSRCGHLQPPPARGEGTAPTVTHVPPQGGSLLRGPRGLCQAAATTGGPSGSPVLHRRPERTRPLQDEHCKGGARSCHLAGRDAGPARKSACFLSLK